MWITAFKTGTHTDMGGTSRTFTREDLDLVVSKFDPAKRKAPACVGHPELNSPAYGWFDQVKREGDFLRMHLGEKTAEFAEALKKGLYKYVSLAFKPDGSIRHVGFLGGHPPAIEGLGEVQFAAEDADTRAYQFADYNMTRLARMFQSLREYIIQEKGIEVADRTLNPWDIEQLDKDQGPAYAEQPPNPETTMTVKKTAEQFEAELAQANARITTLEGEKGAATTQLTQLQFAQAREADKTYVQGLGSRVLPAHQSKIVDILGILREKGEFAFAEGGKAPAIDAFKGFLQSLPEQLAYGEQFTAATAGAAGAGAGADQAGPASQKIGQLVDQKLAKDSTLDYASASKLVYAENPELAKAYHLELQQ